MPLPAGARLGPYEIVAPLGAGGMGEVYRATDIRLSRSVAIKVLPESLALDPQFRERFDREARAISQLAHPNVCTLYDVGEDHGTAFLVMELLAGETLAERLVRAGRALPVDEALALGCQIAEGLAAAHRAGIVHRDLKPANVFLARVGGGSGAPVVKLLDFGLAKDGAVSTGAGEPAGALIDHTASPTVSAPLTAQGTILGTFQYMPPEQIEGAEADRRADIWALGCVLYEMLAGRRAFSGKTHASLVGAIMHADPEPLALGDPLAPPALDHLVRRCLAKDPDDRWQDVRDVAAELRWIAAAPRSTGIVAAPTVTSRRDGVRRAVPIAALTLVSIVAGTIAVRHLREGPTRQPPIRFQVVTPTIAGLGGVITSSPDGRTLAFLARGSTGEMTLHTRSTDSTAVREVPQVRQLSPIAFSPDGRRVAVAFAGKLRVIDLGSESIRDLADIPFVGGRTLGLAWSTSGDIAVAVSAIYPETGVYLVKVDTGGTRKLTTSSDIGYLDPVFIEDGRAIVVLEERGRDHKVCVVLITGQERGCTSIEATTIAYAEGFLLFGRDSTVWVQRFDTGRVALAGEPRIMAEKAASGSPGRLFFAVSSGPAAAPTFAYFSGADSADSRFAWFDRNGRQQETVGDPAAYTSFDLSPSARFVVAARRTESAYSAWVLDVVRGVATRSADITASDDVVWAPDERRFAFVDTATQQIFEQPAFGGTRRLIGRGTTGQILGIEDWSRDGRYLALNVSADQERRGVAQPVDGGKPIVFAQGRALLDEERFSPDVKWVAYSSDESGRQQVYVTPFPPTGEHWQVSTDGGVHPRWNGNGRELFYLALDGTLMAAAMEPGSIPQIGKPAALFKTDIAPTSIFDHFGVSADGQRFLLKLPVAGREESRLNVVVNWTSDVGLAAR
jgi:eukaryotic-like serine/threonine-protein kinase